MLISQEANFLLIPIIPHGFFLGISLAKTPGVGCDQPQCTSEGCDTPTRGEGSGRRWDNDDDDDDDDDDGVDGVDGVDDDGNVDVDDDEVLG